MSDHDSKFDGETRIRRSRGEAVRGDRSTEDAARHDLDGGSLSALERRQQLRQQWVQEVLPTPPEIPGFKTTWLSTTSSIDPIYKRMQMGYVPVKLDEAPQLKPYMIQDGEMAGCIQCNEMLLFKIDVERYQDLMMIYHHDMPAENEQAIYDTVMNAQEQIGHDSNGKPLAVMEEGFKNLSRRARTPVFH